MLNGQEMVDRKIITGPIEKENIQQHGLDLNLIKVEKLSDWDVGIIPTQGKTKIIGYKEIPPSDKKHPLYHENTDLGWHLTPGVYSLTFAQGCDIPKDQMLLIRQRSSLLRNGSVLHSSVFDAGFKTDNIGTIMVVNIPIWIGFNARVAQIYNHDCLPVQNLYEGQWQGDKQRESNV